MASFSAAPIIVAKTRRILKRFEAAEATSLQRAKTIDELGLRHSLIFRRLVQQRVIVEASPGRYFLSQENLFTYNERRRTRMMYLLAAIGIIIIISMLYNYLQNS